MAQIPYQPQNPVAQQSDGNILITWNGSQGATGYLVQRSTDGVNFSTLATLGLVVQYLDSLPGLNTLYYYQVIATNTAGNSVPSSIVQMVAAPPSEMSLYELRLRSQQTADRVNSGYVTTDEWNAFIRLAAYELYDLLIDAYEDWNATAQAFISTDGITFQYPLPDGVTNYKGGTYGGASGTPAPAFYKMAGVDLNVNTSTITPSRVTIQRFDFVKRNQYVYPNSTSTIYGVYNMRYRLMGNLLWIIPTPAGAQNLVLWYTPKMPQLLLDTDTTVIGVSGWLRYVIVRTAIYALTKEEGTDTTTLQNELLFLKQRIEEASQNRDAGMPDTVSETRIDPAYGGTGWGAGGGGQAGWAALFLPMSATNYFGNHLLTHSIHFPQLLLGYVTFGIAFAYFFDIFPSKFCRRVCFSWRRTTGINLSSFRNHILHIFRRSAEE